jgi:dTDP-4-amino-4,6-dideoxygalactose transaminase
MLGVRHAAAVSSGTAAIHLALLVLGVRQGDFVICSSRTFVASANPIRYQGAEPGFVDSEAGSWNMCPVALSEAIERCRSWGRPPKAVLAVNPYGQSSDVEAIAAICARDGIPLVEDAAESLGALYKWRPSDTAGDLVVFSFNGNKIITTSGGGMLVAKDPEHVKRARFLATQAREPVRHYEHVAIGFNYRMSNILAGVGRGQIRMLPERVRARRAIFDRYRAALDGIPGIEWMPEPAWSTSTRWLSVLALDRAAAPIDSGGLIDRLAAELIEARPVWKPMHRQPVFAGCVYVPHSAGSLSDRLFEEGVCLPSGSSMSEQQVDRVILALQRSLKA